jgi:hypothetical protein
MPSFETEFAYIRYTMTATVLLQLGIDKSVNATFTVLHKLDLNTYPEYKQSINKCAIEYSGCWCGKSGPTEIRFEINKCEE